MKKANVHTISVTSLLLRDILVRFVELSCSMFVLPLFLLLKKHRGAVKYQTLSSPNEMFIFFNDVLQNLYLLLSALYIIRVKWKNIHIYIFKGKY